ncbi:uncharacterized protein LOC125060979 [Pieris napi]|uniref:uncharacterized protein LOC125060979 n=1 Tax=Pieris napi TaxID=78633 RepID=UPI001FBA7880|nr:uncharacterized protein LOC125060979 [Pieris napi]
MGLKEFLRLNGLLISVILLSFIYTCSAISCYECNSANNSMCLEPNIYDKESVQRYLKITNCEQKVPRGQTKEQMFCRKIIQTILHKGHDTEVRVTRGCGWVKHHRDCYKADNEDHLETVCQCFTDDCNSAAMNTAGLLIPIIVFKMFI